MLRKKVFLNIAVFGIATVLVLPFFAFAALTSVTDLAVQLDQIVRWFTAIIFIIAIIMILVAAFLFITAAGNQERVDMARRTLLYALLGIAVALVAQLAASFVANVLGVPEPKLKI
ncbi:MAG: hypothetical protein HYW90_01095 [Candidatus Sungbacteria bacterium]|nr:hypothetical protein [Candidatus Sungbacteria bacterium]